MSDARGLTPSATSLAAYQQQQGFAALQQAQAGGDASRDAILNEVQAAKLRGRGGAGVLTGAKWQVALDAIAQRGGPATVVCNAYDADPKAQVAHYLLTAQPFLVLEGIALAAQALRAHDAYLYLRSKNADGYAAMQDAVRQAQDSGLLGNLTVTLVGVDVGFMGGEESTLLEVIKGRRAMARQRPPFPAQSGLDDLPTVVDSVETLAQVAKIMRQGAAAYAKSGSTLSPGTKFVTIYDTDGQARMGEVPFGATVASVLKQAGLTVTPQTARGVVVGGPEGGVLPPDAWNTPFDYEALREVGAIVGSGTIEVLPADTCMVHWAQTRMNYLARESCGKCIPCRSGTKRVAGALEGIMSDIGTAGDIDLLNEFADYIPASSICGFGWNATHPLRTALRYFADDFQQHLAGECPTGTCIPVRSHRFATKGVL
jgi:NADH-quinone oxidoreductase subunit F